MVTRTEEEWRSLFEAYDGSDLSAAEFCRRNKLCPKYFSLRRKQLLGYSATPASRSFAKVRPPKQLVVMAGDVTLRVGSVELAFTAVAPEFIAAVVKQLA